MTALAINENEAAASLFDKLHEPLDLRRAQAVWGQVAEDDKVVREQFVAGGGEAVGGLALRAVSREVIEGEVGLPAFVAVEMVVDVTAFPARAPVKDEDAAFALEDMEGNLGKVVGAGFFEAGLAAGGGDLGGEETEGLIGAANGDWDVLHWELEVKGALTFARGGESLLPERFAAAVDAEGGGDAGGHGVADPEVAAEFLAAEGGLGDAGLGDGEIGGGDFAAETNGVERDAGLFEAGGEVLGGAVGVVLAVGEKDDRRAGCEGFGGGGQGGIKIGGLGIGRNGNLTGKRACGIATGLASPPQALGGGAAESGEFDIVLVCQGGQERQGALEEEVLGAVPAGGGRVWRG